MKLNLISNGTLLVALFLGACGSDSGTDSGKDTSESKAQYETFIDLPNCTSSREGEIAEILDDGEFYICKAKKWEEYVEAEIKSYPTEDDMPSCNFQNENSLALVEADSVIQVCKDSRWETLGHSYANEESLPNCSKNREGERAYLMEESEIQLCRDGVWGAMGEQPTSSEESKDDNDKDNESKSSEKEGASNSKVVESSDSQNPQSNNSDDIKSSDSEIPTSGSSGDKNSSDSESERSSASIAPGVTEGTFTDPRDGQTYRTVKIGDQEWFAQNLNYNMGDTNSWCPLHKLSYCEKYGRMYAQSAYGNCPKGWHVPFETDWETLFAYVEEKNDGEGVGKSLKASTGWYEEGWHEPYIYDEEDDRFEEYVKNVRVAVATGDDIFRFSALPAGSCWSTCYSDDDAVFRVGGSKVNSNVGSIKIAYDKNDIIRDYPSSASIRCIKNNESVEIDPLPKSMLLGGVEITSENVTHGGTDEFNPREVLEACPEGWRLPYAREITLLLDYLGTGSWNHWWHPFYVLDYERLGLDPKYVRCVKE